MQGRVLSEADIVSRCRAITRPGSYMLLPQANRVTSFIPGFRDTVAQVLATPQLGACFVQYELLLSAGGASAEPIDDGLEHFLYILEGSVELTVAERMHRLGQGGYVWLPPGVAYELKNARQATGRVLWLRRPYEIVEGLAVPKPIISREEDVAKLPEDTYLEQHLIPYENPAFDMGVNLLNFEPGVYFGFVESHVMEHGLYMLAGRGIYWLNGDYHEVQANDFIYMAPYCPQFFYATGWESGRYLVYKDVNRDYADVL
jgi:(S)-ureidoglycine aminohydrolase